MLHSHPNAHTTPATAPRSHASWSPAALCPSWLFHPATQGETLANFAGTTGSAPRPFASGAIGATDCLDRSVLPQKLRLVTESPYCRALWRYQVRTRDGST